MHPESTLKIYETPFEMAEKFAIDLTRLISAKVNEGKDVSLVLSGGTTPELLYSVIGDHFSNSVNWQNVKIFWGDERCVPSTDHDSNYGMTVRSMLSKIRIPEKNIHRIRGENDPQAEALRYSLDIKESTVTRDDLPLFDIVILGIGEDGHTASIFPSDLFLLESDRICEVTSHPLSGQKRITVTGRVLNNADLVAFIATGAKKADVVRKILAKEPGSSYLPASFIVPRYGRSVWILDREAASRLDMRNFPA